MLFRPLSGKYNYGLGQTQWAKMCEACCEFKLALYFFIIAINPLSLIYKPTSLQP